MPDVLNLYYVGTSKFLIFEQSASCRNLAMAFRYADTLEKYNWIGGGLDAYIFHVTPTIVVKTVRRDRTPEEEAAKHPFLNEIAFFKRLDGCQDRCSNIIECFLMLPDHIFLSYCTHQAIALRFYERQEREVAVNGIHGCLIRVKEYEDPALIARWIRQLTCALEYVEKMGFCHNDLHAGNYLLDENFNLKLTDFGRATTIGQLLEGTLPPRARPILAGPLKGTYGLCSARTEQFAVGTLLYFMVYGHEPYDDVVLSAAEWDRRFWEMEFPELNRHDVFDGLISACWYNVYPTMVLVAYDFKRKTKDIVLNAENVFIDSLKEKRTCEALIRRGLLGPELALSFQPVWRKYVHAIAKRSISIWQCLLNKRFLACHVCLSIFVLCGAARAIKFGRMVTMIPSFKLGVKPFAGWPLL
ncbi:protein kinase domain-containing protein [Microsporum canis CBS 113480]|uniref:Protein kinase domain-containing protein n=1 Tax=Arthroderma otae (strain ATCC MYA-4605 / CBS 113480) TaxID=554155 RepID=C5FIM9_ARTOC|nr:protein kinase domain-containing protein [Microsporum canis CBS 113480]EEQ29298.1 protein kinase domain-containing protein [Microsporum canis CBS 113480]